VTTKRWDFRDEDLRRYTVVLEHGTFSGKRVITLNGREVFRGQQLIDTGSEHRFDFEGHSGVLRVRNAGLRFEFDLLVDGNPVPPQGATIPRSRAADTAARGSVAPIEPSVPTQAGAPAGPTAVELERADLERRVRNGGRWFYWIAALTVLNVVAYQYGSSLGFGLGMVIGFFLQGVLAALGETMSWIAHVITVGLFVFFGLRAAAGAMWAFVVGGAIYLLDGLLYIDVGDFISIVVHAFALFALWSGARALSQLRRLTAPEAPAI
jgi:hypothetical protein